MATIRLVPSTYALLTSQGQTTTYLTMADADHMYNNTDNTTYATITHNRNSTTAYYLYIRGFNFSLPSGAEVSSFTIKIKALESGLSTSSSYRMSLYNGTTSIASTTVTSSLGTSAQTFTFPNGSLSWSILSGYGANFGIRVPIRRNSQNTSGYVRVYGAEIEVTYTVPVYHTVTTTLSGNGTIVPSGTESYREGDTYDLTVTPTNVSDTVTATKNGTAITLTQHSGGEYEESNVLGAYLLVSGGFNGSGGTYFSGLVGKGHTASQTTSNYYSSGNGTIAVFTYDVPFTDIPDNATIKNLYMLVNGHAESTSQSAEYMCARLISGSTNLSNELNFKSVGTTNTTQTVTANVTPTIAQLENLKVQCRLGYYGGAINGATVYLEYEVSGVWYTYSTTIDGDMTIAVTIGGGTSSKIYVKVNGSWVAMSKGYKKVNGSWVETDITELFDSNKNYKKG